MVRKKTTVMKGDLKLEGDVKSEVTMPMHEIVLHHPDELRPAEYNPRTIKPAMLQALKVGIRRNGFLQAIVVQKKGMTIVGGHQRLRALREVCQEDDVALPKVPCVVLDIDDREAKKLNIALNRVGGDFDTKLLGEVLYDLDTESKFKDFELVSMGYSIDDINRSIALARPDLDHTPDEPKEFGRSITISIEFSSVKKRDACKKVLAERAKLEKRKTGEIVYGLLGGGRK